MTSSQAYLILIHDKQSNRIEPVGIGAASAEEAIVQIFEDLRTQNRLDDVVIGAFTSQDVMLMKHIIDGVGQRTETTHTS